MKSKNHEKLGSKSGASTIFSVAASIWYAYLVSPEYSVRGGTPLSLHFMTAFPDIPLHTFPTASKLPKISRAFIKFNE